MFLDFQNQDFGRDIIPFLKNGIILDTSVFLIIINGLISTRISKKELSEFPDCEQLFYLLDRIKVNNKWHNFLITPHIFTEVCTHLRNQYSKQENYQGIVEEILPLLASMVEKQVEKEYIIERVNFKYPIVEVGDISIYVVADRFLEEKKKVAILSIAGAINTNYQDHPKVLVMDFKSVALAGL